MAVRTNTNSWNIGNGLAAVVHENHPNDIQQIQRRCAGNTGWIDLREPFDRIREAIAEALKGNAKAAA